MSKIAQFKQVPKEPRVVAPFSAAKRVAGKGAYIGATKTTARKPREIDKVIAMMRRSKGATIADITKATDWQAHSVRGVISGTIKRKWGLKVASEKVGDVRTYRIAS